MGRLTIREEVVYMLRAQEGDMQMKKNVTIYFLNNDIWKQMVMSDAIRSDRKVKTRIFKYF